MLNQFKNLSCYEEFEIQCTLTGISKIDVLKEIGYRIDDYYFFISTDGIFNWFDLEGNHIEDPGVLKELKEEHIPKDILKCIIPNSVTNIDDRAFSKCKSLTSITIPNSVTNIDDRAFSKCKSLTSITIPASVTCIGTLAFFNCESLTSIIIPDNLIYIGVEAFSWCISLNKITISDSVTRIGNGAFYNCESLTSITIPDSVTCIGHSTFSFCKSLKEVVFKGKCLDKVERMNDYPFGIKDKSIIKCEL